MIISHTRKYIFIKSTKTAGTSIEAALSNYCAGPDIVTPLGNYSVNRDETGAWVHKAMNEGSYRQHDDAVTIKRSLPPEVWSSYFKFSIARNPWERTLSRFFWNHRNDPALKPKMQILPHLGGASDELATARRLFGDFVRHGRLDTNDRFYIIDGDLCIDDIIRYECLSDDFARVCAKLGLLPMKLPRLKSGIRSREEHYSVYYDDDTRDIVAEKHRKDIELFGYRFETVS